MELPERFGKYAVTGVIGKGAMGVVYKAFDPLIERVVALKTIHRNLVGDEGVHAVERFRREARAAGRLSHPGIVAVFDYGEEGDLAFIAMEFVQGHDLADYFKRGVRFDARDAVSIVLQLLDALGHAHKQGVVHRDVKPSNILIMPNGRVKVADFGIARIDVSELTQAGMTVGTPSYMAPEQYLGHQVDGRADLFAAGVLLYQLLTGVKPFQGPPHLLAYKVCHEAAPRPSTVSPQVSHAFDDLLDRALAKKPDDRFQTAREFRDALLAAYAGPVADEVSGDTLILDPPVARAVQVEAAPAVGPGRPGTSPSGGTPVPEGWDAAVLERAQRLLAPHVGPLARVLVRKAAAATRDADEFHRRLAEEIEQPADRRRFLEQCAGAAPAPATVAGTSRGSGGGAVPGGGAITPEMVEAATRQLAPWLGPIARIVARRTAPQAASAEQYYLLLAEQLTDAADRRAFLKAVGLS